MARRKTTVYLDEDIVRASRVLAARTGQHEYEIVNAALRSFLGLAACLPQPLLLWRSLRGLGASDVAE